LLRDISYPEAQALVMFLSICFDTGILPLRWENLGNFSQSLPRIYFVKSQYSTSRGVNWKMLRLKKVLLQFAEKGGNGCFDVIHDFVDKLS
jgi:hypothetical protein